MSKRLQKVISVTTSVTTVLWLSGIAALAPLAASAVTINNGDTIKTAASPDVYIAKYVGTEKFKRLILSPTVFNSYGHLSWSAIKTVSQAEMDVFTESMLVRAVGDPKVYKLTPEPNSDNGQKQWVNMTAEAFTAGGWSWNSIYEINGVDRDNYAAASAGDITGGTPSAPVVASASPSTSVTPAAGGVTVALASDTPAAGVAVGGSARVPFTKVSFTAGAADATITGLTVQRTGLADDRAIASVTLIDDATNLTVGLSQTLNALHQATLTEPITISANTTKTYTIAGNMPALATAALYAGQIASLSLVSVTAGGTVSGTLPITGNGQTINGTLTIGSATVTAGSLDPNTALTKEVGTTNYKFSGVRVTAGSTEDMTVYSIKWNQSGSAASGDLANVKVSDGTTDYATTVSSDGKYYTASFGTTGILVGKGLNKEFTIKGDIMSGSARTISFDVYKDTDIMIKGNNFGYYVTPTFTANGAATTVTTTFIQAAASPYFGGSNVTIGAGSLRVEKNSANAPAANITSGAQGQILGAFNVIVQGEAINVTSLVVDFNFAAASVGSTSDITSITLSKADGTVIAGPVNGTDDGGTDDGDGDATFSGTMTFPVGTTVLIVKGNLNTDVTAGSFAAEIGNRISTAHGITGATGVTTGNAVTPSGYSATLGTTGIVANTMTIRTGSLTVTVSGAPVAQTVVGGVNGFTFTNYVFNATASGEDVKVTSLVLLHGSSVASTQSQLSGLALYDGVNALNTGSNVLTGNNGATTDTAYASTSLTFTLDNPLVVPKGTTKTIALKGNIVGGATAAIQGFGIANATASVVATGVSTGSNIAEAITAATGQAMTIAAAGQYSAALDSSSPTGKLIVANTTGNIMTTLRFLATAEDINVDKIDLQLTSASSTSNDLSAVYIYDGATLLNDVTGSRLGTGNATGGAGTATIITLTTPLQLKANEEKVVTIKADLAPIYTTATQAVAGHQIAIDVVATTVATSNGGTGQSSGTRIAGFNTTAATTAQASSYIYRSVPTVAKVAVDTTKLANGDMDLLKFSVTADAKGAVDLYKFTVRISTTTATVTFLQVLDVTGGVEQIVYDSGAGPISGWAAGTTDINVLLYAPPGTIGTAVPRTVAAGITRTFAVRGTVGGATTGASVVTQLQGDTDYDKVSGVYTAAADTVDTALNDDFIWSDWSAASHSITTLDWVNGYLVSGLPSSNLTPQTLSF